MHTDRRKFLIAGAAWTALSRNQILGANDRIRVGVIGTGGRSRELMSSLAKNGGNELVALCDVYQPRLAQAQARFAPGAELYEDYRKLLDRADIDAVVIASPDHWHVPMTMDAVNAGKDVYVEKPVTHTIEQGPILVKAVRASDRIVQIGLQQRSWEHFQTAVGLIRAGKLGQINFIRTYWFQNYLHRPAPEEVDTAKLDWQRWLGSAPDQPFDLRRFTTWRWYWDFGGGALTDLFTHWVDVVHWAMESDTPQLAQTLGATYSIQEWQCPDTVLASFHYPKFTLAYEGTMVCSLDDGGLVFRGTDAMLKLDRTRLTVYPEGAGFVVAQTPPTVDIPSKADGTIAHMQNFLDCIKSRKEPNASVEAGVAAARAAHLGNQALRSGTAVRVSA